MKWNNSNRIVTSLITLAAFCWLSHLAAVPLGGENAAPNQTGIARENETGLIEAQTEPGQTRNKSKSPLIPILIGAAVFGIVATVVILAVIKAKYDIRGNWVVYYSWQDAGSGVYQILFSGDRGSGMFDHVEAGLAPQTGTYSVDGRKVTWTFPADNTVYTGEFITRDMMDGTSHSPALSASGTWTAERMNWYIPPTNPQNRPEPASKAFPRR